MGRPVFHSKRARAANNVTDTASPFLLAGRAENDQRGPAEQVDLGISEVADCQPGDGQGMLGRFAYLNAREW